MDLEALRKGLSTLNAPNQGMSYHAGGVRRGGPAFDAYTGKRLAPDLQPAELNVYGERARFLYELIRNADALAALLSSQTGSAAQAEHRAEPPPSSPNREADR